MTDELQTTTPTVEEGAEAASLDASPDTVAESVAETSDQPAVETQPETQPAAIESPVTDPQPVEAEPTPAPADASEPEAPAPPQVEVVSDADLFDAAMASMNSEETGRETSSGISKGDRVEAKVIQVEKDRVFVDLGTKAEGVVPLNELTDLNVDTAVGVVKPGDTFDVIVLKAGSAEGAPIVSKRKADFDQTWQRVLDAFDEGKVFEAQVVDRVKGGLVVDIGVRGFVPATHVGNGKLRNLEKFVGQTLAVKIIEIERERKKVVLSNRSAESERKEEVKAEIFDNVKPGDVMEGTVRRLTDYGAFVDLGGIDGLLHISEMSWFRIDHPREVIKEGDDLKVMVLRLDSASGRVSLGLRQVLPDPWNLIRENYKQGEKIKVKVSRIVQSGAFVRLPEGAEAFLPLSECSNKRVKKPNEVLTEGEEIEPTIIDLRPDERRMVLSLRDGATPGSDYSYGDRGRGRPGMGQRGVRRGPRQDQSTEAPQATMRTPTGGATIGERLGMLKGILKSDGPEEASEETTES
ncbi:MAG: 30S ribosomal protein S1 [Fimbriimonadaceae bacterium]|nr:30S ribosomal protein S1 [Fimbriimonadaceae bacterium]QYK58532.1 MAG: 30S ribosomal protein S1 [Fimbriimonadaceae bacterium]